MTGSKLGRTSVALAVLALMAAASQPAFAEKDNGNVQTRLDGYQEVPTLSTSGQGRFKARINDNRQTISYELSYEGLESSILQAHIHFAARATNGPIVVFLCTNLGNGPAGTQLCPDAPATITGTITPADILAGAAAMGLEAGIFDELVDALFAGATYANVHTTGRPGGEIRGQIGHQH